MLFKQGVITGFKIRSVLIGFELINNPEIDYFITASRAFGFTAMACIRINGSSDKPAATIMSVDSDPACGEDQHHDH
jgi:hypothetical protein